MQGRSVPLAPPRDVRSRFTDRELEGLILGSSPRMTEVAWWWGCTLSYFASDPASGATTGE